MTVCKFWQNGFCRNGSTIAPSPLPRFSLRSAHTTNEIGSPRGFVSRGPHSSPAPSLFSHSHALICLHSRSLLPPLLTRATPGNCRFEHPPKNQPTQSTNRFGALAPSANMSNNREPTQSPEVVRSILTPTLKQSSCHTG